MRFLLGDVMEGAVNSHFPPFSPEEKLGGMGESRGKWGNLVENGIFWGVFAEEMGNAWAKTPQNAKVVCSPTNGRRNIIDLVLHGNSRLQQVTAQTINTTGLTSQCQDSSSDVHTIVEHPTQEGDMITVQEPLDYGRKWSVAGTFSQSLPTIDPQNAPFVGGCHGLVAISGTRWR